MHSKITAMQYCIPQKRLTNSELEERFGEKHIRSITKMSGIFERRIVSNGITASDLAFQAAQQLIESKSVDLAKIDLLIFASQTGDYQLPATSAVLHRRLGLSDRCATLDLSLGCPSFPYCLSVVHGMLATRQATHALVINADALTTVIHPMDRGLVPLHGDGAVATLVEWTDAPGGRIGKSFLGTDGSGFEHLIIPASGARMVRSEQTKREMRDESGVVRTLEHLHMNGPAVFHFSIYKVPEVINKALATLSLCVSDLDLVILHQANKMMVDQIYRSLNVPMEKRFYFMENVGNMSGASSPMVLAEALRMGAIHENSRTLVAAFGVGLSWGVSVIEWESPVPIAISTDVNYVQYGSI